MTGGVRSGGGVGIFQQRRRRERGRRKDQSVRVLSHLSRLRGNSAAQRREGGAVSEVQVMAPCLALPARRGRECRPLPTTDRARPGCGVAVAPDSWSDGRTRSASFGGLNRQTGRAAPRRNRRPRRARRRPYAFKFKKPSQTGGKGDIRPTPCMLSPWSRPAPRLEHHKVQRRPSLISCEVMSLNVVGLKTLLMPVEVMTSPAMPSPRWV
jgi:hypothetical protein